MASSFKHKTMQYNYVLMYMYSSDKYSLAYLVSSGTIPSLVSNRCMQPAGDRRAGLLLVTGGWPPVVDS